MKPTNIIVCVRVGETLAPDGAPWVPSEVARCGRCWHEVTISMASLAMAKEKDAEPVCVQCAVKLGLGDREIEPVSDDQKDEFIAALMRMARRPKE